ncbi:LAME_0C04852g1_1 [Lachancea meyersii CBS 8951]|uniref:LAME_0C04852g1_1 n=1 Tax=Lachancea meyersii CBS 8951 TaxID=1266667 RepID=A0A1G4J1J0_9SACH|nr:LAME_0C04852g1_1 [Lachancea meyersii CBS 8951]
MPQLLCIPFKRSLPVDLNAELSKVIDRTFYQVASLFDADLKTIDTLRNSALEAEVSTTGLQTLQEYYFQFSRLKLKFPDEQITFKWFETLGLKSYGREDTKFVFEELNVVYNIGALYSLLAADINNGSPEGLKAACSYYRLGAGCFDFISSRLDLMNDAAMEPKSIRSLKFLMLAQAQEIFWLKAVRDGMKHSLIARLALQVAEYYDSSFKYASTSELIRSDWQHRFGVKAIYFRAVALYRYSLTCDDNSLSGHKVRSLRDSSALLKQIHSADDTVHALSAKVEEALKVSERDNDLIYLQSVPTSIPNLKAAPMVSTLYFDGLREPLSPDPRQAHSVLFSDLLPTFVMESSNAFNRRQEQYIQQHVIDPLKALNKLVDEELPAHNVSKDLRSVPEEELESCRGSLEEAGANARQVASALRQVSDILRREQETDNLLRLKYGTARWTIEPSEKVNAEYLSRHSKLESYLQTGEAIDRETLQLFESIDKSLITSDIKIPESNNPLVKEISSVFSRREQITLQAKNKATTTVLLPKIVSLYKQTGQTDFEDLFAEQLKVYDEDLLSIEREKNVNRVLLDRLKTQDREGERQYAQDLYVQDFQFSLKLLEDVKENLSGGSKFYRDLVSSVSSLLSDVQIFEAARTEKNKDAEKDIAQGSNDQHG